LSNSTTSSNEAESLAPGVTIGKSGEVAEQVRLELGLPGSHPVAVALHRVDLSVVGDHAERLGERPRREGVGRVARVHESELRCESVVGEVGVERLELERRDHALVDQGATAQRGEVDVEFALGLLAQSERLAVERDAPHRHSRPIVDRAREEQLLEERHRLPCEGAEPLRAHRHLAPAENGQPFRRGEGLDSSLGGRALGAVDREEGHADDVAADLGEGEVDDRAQERIRNLGDDAGAVAGARIRADRATVLEVAERAEGGVDDVVPRGAAKGRDHGEATGIPFAPRVVHAGRGRGGAEAGESWRECHCETVLTKFT
jgi:hypothetical protein